MATPVYTRCTVFARTALTLRKIFCMKPRRLLLLIFILLLATASPAAAQCSICTKTAQQLGEKPAKALNTGILYLAFMPLALIGVLGYQWWRYNRKEEKE
jgi:hypothetical protein